MQPDTPEFHVAPSPHIFQTGMSTRGMMRNVLLALLPAVGMAVYLFQLYAVKQLLICVGACMASEWILTRMRKRPHSLTDLSAMVSGVILGLSLPGTAPWYIGCIASAVAMGIGKMVFGGLGQNIFNPAMVGRVFVMIAFAGDMAATGYVKALGTVDAISQATPLNAYKQLDAMFSLGDLFWGTTNGSLGETSAAACLLGGLYLCLRRVASWEIPTAILTTVAVIGGIDNLLDIHRQWTVIHHLCGGAVMFGAFFIATDPVTSPLTFKGKWIFGAGIGALVMLLRLFSGYPEGLMFAVLLMNAVTPLINQWTIPRPFGDV